MVGFNANHLHWDLDQAILYTLNRFLNGKGCATFLITVSDGKGIWTRTMRFSINANQAESVKTSIDMALKILADYRDKNVD